MSLQFWHSFCEHGENFTTWRNGDFGHCFEQIVVICPSYIILSIFSAYYIAAAKHSSRGVCCPLPWFVKFRLLTVILCSILAVSAVIVTRILGRISVSWSDVTVAVLTAATWLIHAVYVYRLKYLYWSSWRGAGLVVIIYFLTILSLAAQLHTNIIQRVNDSPSHNIAEEFSVYVLTFLQVSYLVTLIPKWERVRLIDDTHYGPINEDPDEASSLLQTSVHSYSSVPRSSQQCSVGEDDVNCFSWLAFHWVQPLLVKGARKCINNVNDMFLLPDRLNTLFLFNKFSSVLNGRYKEFQRSRAFSADSSRSSSANSIPDVAFSSSYSRQSFRDVTVSDKPSISLYKALNQSFGLQYYSIGLLKLLGDCLGFAGPILLNLLVNYMETKTEPEKNGYFYALGLMLSTFLGSLCSTQFDYNCNVIGLKIRTAIITTIYRKSLSVSSVHMRKFTSGQITNFMSTDTDRIVNFCPSFHAVWSLPFQIAVSLYLLHQQVGLAFLAGLGFAIVLVPINRWLAIKIGQLSKAMMEQKDNRVKVMNEILFGMRVIKFYAWEDHFRRKIGQLRDAELKSLRGRKYLDAMCVYFWATTPVLISILTFTTYSLMGHQLTAAKVFTSLSLFLMLISPLNAFPWVLNGLMEAWVSLQRVQQFIILNDLDVTQYYSSNTVLLRDCSLHVTDADFSWRDPSDDDCSSVVGGAAETGNQGDQEESGNQPQPRTQGLENINIHVTKGQFIGVIGKVGSGKSSLLACLLAEMHRSRGHVRVNDLDSGFAIVTQEPWIQHATIRDNILFGRQFNSRRYEMTIEACALQEDFKIFPAGDRTEVGENGVTLSGGQKARVALARACYQNKDVYLLDDPLAAVDAHVALHLYQKCIMGALWGKTRVLCTHHTKYLVNADLVILMDAGRIVKTGFPSEILGTVEEALKEEDHEGDPRSRSSTTEDDPASQVPVAGGDGSLVEEEEKETGVVKLGIYKSYWSAVGGCLAPSVLLALFFMQASRNINDWWLSYWVTNAEKTPDHNTSHGLHTHDDYSSWGVTQYRDITEVGLDGKNSTGHDSVMFYLTVYGCLAGANSVFTLLRAFLFAYGGICAAQKIHIKLLDIVLKAPIAFFDITPIGRIVNRFSSDVFSIDDSLPFIMNIFLAQIYGILGTIVITCYGLPWFAVLLLPLGLLYYKIQNYYRHTSREIKRISSVTLSPIYAHFSETITGLTTIRGFREHDRFQRENLERLDVNQRARFAAQAVASWLGFRLQMLGVAMVTGIAFIAVLEHHFQTINAGLVGLAISYSLSVTNLLGGVVNSFAETEKQMVSVERAQQYIDDIPSEPAEGSLLPPPYWPIQGSIVFRNVRMKYRGNLPDALNKVSFEVEPAEKVGIVGRTGSGKSSLFLALFRMVEISKGNIFVDGIDLIHLDLRDIRSRFAIIPQEPFLFSGTVRENLDPTNTYTDTALWSALKKCHLAAVVEFELKSRFAIIPQEPFLFSGTVRENLDPTNTYTDTALWLALEKCHLAGVVERLGGLEADVAERGRHFSVGQRQLVCLARALLTRAKILCIDEATASVDLETDMLIQQTIRSEFADSTVLTIAHRINTVLDSDRVLVMHEGRVLEFGPPGRLLMNTDSYFYKLVHGKSP